MTEEEKKQQLDNVVLVGKKSVRTYAEAVMIQFNEKKSKEVILKTRGNFITRAINATEYLKRKEENIKVKEIKIGSESFRDKETDKEIYVSSIEITLTKD